MILEEDFESTSLKILTFVGFQKAAAAVAAVIQLLKCICEVVGITSTVDFMAFIRNACTQQTAKKSDRTDVDCMCIFDAKTRFAESFSAVK